MKPQKLFTTAIIYLAVILAVIGVVTLRARARVRDSERRAQAIAVAERKAKSDDPEVKREGESELAAARANPESKALTDPEAKPSFTLSTNRTYATTKNPRVWINYEGLKYLDFRVYRVNDPAKFFKQLDNPHEMGEREKKEVASSHRTSPSLLERVRAFKSAAFRLFKNYFRDQLKRESRTTFNQKFRKESARTPLNVADYARVPLLNPDQLVSSWREEMAPLDYAYDTLMVPLGKRDPGVYLVEAINGDLRAYTIAIISDITVINKAAPNGDMLVYAADRKTGAPAAGVQVEIARKQKTFATGTTEASGVFHTRIEKEKEQPQASPSPSPSPSPVPDGEGESQTEPTDSFLIMASKRDHFAVSDLESTSLGMGDDDGEGVDQGVTGYIYTERPVYRPAQKVYFKGILRRLGDNGYEMLTERSVTVTIEDPNGGKLLEKELPLSSRGTFNGEVDLASGAALGSYRIIAVAGEAQASDYFEVQEYKKPEYKVSVTTPKKFVPVGSSVKFSIEARYFFGAPVTTADVQYYIYRSRYYHGWWGEGDEGDEGEESDETEGYYGYGNDMVQDGEGSLNKNGRLDVEFTVPQPDENDPYDYTYRLEAQVTDAARRTIEGAASFVGTRGSVVADANPNRYVYAVGDTAKISVQTATYEGKPVSANVTLEFVQRTWDKTPVEGGGFEYKTRETKLASANVQTDAQGQGSYDYKVAASGSVYIKTIVSENGKRYASNGGYLWITDQQNAWMDSLNEEYGSIKLVPDKKSYQPGETAHVLAMLPTDKAHLLVTTEMESVLTARPVEATGRAVMIDVPIEARFAPNVYLGVSFIKDDEMYTSDHSLKVPANNKRLNLEIIPNKSEYKPRDTASYTILARNADGSPAAGAEVSLGVVDEAIYSIRPEQAIDIHKAFFGHRYNQVQTNFAVSYYFSGSSGDDSVNLAKNRRAFQLADFKNEGQNAELTIRKEFKDTAFWQADAVTNAEGRAEVKFQLPDNLTTWRATARAVTEDTRVGSSVGRVLARKDLIMRVELPRFMTEGDTVTLSGIVHNYLKSAKQTQISIEVTGAQLLDGPTQSVNIAKDGEHRIDWRVNATQVGQVRILAKALTDAENDAVEMTLDVVPRGLRQNRSELASLVDEQADKSFTLNLPANAHPQARYLRIEASPSVAGTLFGALDYLTGYPYGCTEQTMSSFLPNVIVSQTLQEVKSASLRDTNKIGEKVQRGLDRLYAYQHDDGGWGWWKDDKTDAFMTAYVVDGLSIAKGAGYNIGDDRISRARDALKQMLNSNRDGEGKEIDLETRSYMAYALIASGDADNVYVNGLYDNRNGLQPYGRALLALALKYRGDGRSAEVAGEIERSAKVDGQNAYWESSRQSHYGYVENKSIEASALSIKALSQISPQSELLPKAVRWLVASRRYGDRWDSTKDTAFAIYGLIDYLKVSKELQPDYTIEVYLNGQQVMTHRMTPSDATAGQPVVFLRKGEEVAGNNEVRVVKRGSGVLYLSGSLDFYTGGDSTPAQSSDKLKITREYLSLRVTEGEDGAQGQWAIEPLKGEIRSGDLVVVKLHVQGARGEYLLIEDAIPAGCEQIERTSGINLNYTEGKWTDWYSTREFRDQHTAIFSRVFDGDSTFQYAMRVQIPGQFRVAAARAELMYQPTIQANTASSVMTILDRR